MRFRRAPASTSTEATTRVLTRERLEELGLGWEIWGKGKPAPYWATFRWVVERTSSWQQLPTRSLELPSIGWQLFILDSSQSDPIALPAFLDTYAIRLLTEPLMWCTERVGKVIDFWVAFSDVVIIVRRLIPRRLDALPLAGTTIPTTVSPIDGGSIHQ